jgi:hypothetical protein
LPTAFGVPSSVRAAATPPKYSQETIAILAFPNPNHYSAKTWYANNIASAGSPSELLVDGYEAVRDGRSVYVAAANVIGDQLYTNIYVLSYYQEVGTETADIFGQILKNWKFNFNVLEQGPGICLGRALPSCQADSDCAAANKKAQCFNGSCVQYCQLSTECSVSGTYCDSNKNRLVRDVKRLADMQEMTLVFSELLASNKSYPKLAKGSYLPGRSVSVWSSWTDSLSKEMGRQLPKDPINKLGLCAANFDAITCWDEKSKSFATDFTNPVLPTDSLAYVYSYKADQARYSLCANFETDYSGIPDNWRCDKNLDQDFGDVPRITYGDLTQSEGAYNAYFQIDSPLTIDWKKTKVVPVEPDNWDDWVAAGWKWTNGVEGLSIANTSVANQKKLAATAVKLGDGQDYQFFKFGLYAYDSAGKYGYKVGRIRICQPRDCTGLECGAISDNCGGTLLCGDCLQADYVCVSNKCVKM